MCLHILNEERLEECDFLTRVQKVITQESKKKESL